MLVVTAFAQEMVVVRIYLHLELFASLYKRIDILHRILCVYVVISQTMNYQQLTL